MRQMAQHRNRFAGRPMKEWVKELSDAAAFRSRYR